MMSDLAGGFAALFGFGTFAYLIAGFLLGLAFGAIPGLTATLAVALLLPFTFSMDVGDALVMVMGIYMAGIYSGSITGIILNIPGAPSGAITTIEGHQLMKKGQGAKALGLDAFASSVGGVIGALVLMWVALPMADLALKFQTPDKFSLVVLAVVMVTVVSPGSLWKAVAAMVLGLMLSTVGIDKMQPMGRFDFDSAYLVQGIGLLPAVIGLFAMAELLGQAGTKWRTLESAAGAGFTPGHADFMPTLKEIREIGALTYIKSSVIGTVIGVLPGGGASMASFIAYAEAKRVSKRREDYGHGSHEGLAAAESANNAMCGGALVPLLTLGIPGDSVTAIIFGVLLIHGLAPGPELLQDHFDVAALMFAALFVAAVFVFLSVLALGPYYIRITRLNRGLLYSFVALIAMLGAFAASYSFFQMWVVLIVGAAGFMLRSAGFPIVPILMGVILGPHLEKLLRTSLIVSNGDPTIFLTQPISAALLALTAVFVYFLKVRS